MATSELKDKVIVITGASSGFGKGASLEFARQGASVVLAARREELLDELAQQCESLGGRAVAVPTDVSVADDVAKLAQQAISEFGRIDVWVNNAGSGSIGRFEEIPLEEHVKVIETDLLGTVYGSYAALRHFRERGSGILINISSVIGKVPSPYFSSYAAAKHGVVGLSASIRQELSENHDDNIHVCTVMPTSFDTPFFEYAGQHTGHQVKPIPPLYEPERVVETIVRLATDPEDEVSVGTAAKVATFAHQLAPKLVEKMMARETHEAEITESKAEPESSGSVLEPMSSGKTVTGGWKKPA